MKVSARVVAWCAVVVLGAGVTRTVVALPEHCGEATPVVVEATAAKAVGWFERNQRRDGRWLYRYDTRAGRDLGGYSWIRHAGVLLALEQAATNGFVAARAVADAGRPIILDRLVDHGDRQAVEDGGSLSAGGTGLLVAALGERRVRTGSTDLDDRLRALGRFLVVQVEPDGSVNEQADAATGDVVRGTHSPFSTGEAMFALARLARLFPGEGWEEPARRIGRYVATERADREGYVPDASDHWAAYAFAEVVRWPAALTPDEVAFARKQMGIVSIQVRYESQRTNRGVDRWTRGRQATGAGVGTLGEALAAWSVVAAATPVLGDQRAWLADRLACVAGVLAARQDPSSGAFVQFGITQMDDQQHPLSALLGARRTLDDITPVPRRTPVPSSAWLVALATFVAVNPGRVVAKGPRSGGPTIAGVVAGVLVLGVLAAAGGPIVRALDVSVGTAAVAAGLGVAAAGLVAALWPGSGEREPALGGWGAAVVPVLVPLVLRPEVALLAIAAGAGGRGWAAAAGVVAAGAAAVVSGRWLSDEPGAVTTTVLGWAVRVAAVLTLAAGVAIIVDGVYAV